MGSKETRQHGFVAVRVGNMDGLAQASSFTGGDRSSGSVVSSGGDRDN